MFLNIQNDLKTLTILYLFLYGNNIRVRFIKISKQLTRVRLIPLLMIFFVDLLRLYTTAGKLTIEDRATFA